MLTSFDQNWPGYDLLAYSRMFQWKERYSQSFVCFDKLLLLAEFLSRPSAIADLFCTSDECSSRLGASPKLHWSAAHRIFRCMTDGKPVITAQAFDLLRQLVQSSTRCSVSVGDLYTYCILWVQLTLDPTRRITAESALTHEWFTPSRYRQLFTRCIDPTRFSVSQ